MTALENTERMIRPPEGRREGRGEEDPKKKKEKQSCAAKPQVTTPTRSRHACACILTQSSPPCPPDLQISTPTQKGTIAQPIEV